MRTNILKTITGSHMWDMNGPDSDTDYFEVYLHSIDDILDGRASYRSYETQTDEMDVTSHEAKKVIEMILKGNINYVTGVLSPLVEYTTTEADELRQLVRDNMAKNIYHSTRGMAVANMKDWQSGKYSYVVQNEKGAAAQKKLGQVARILVFGINWLHGDISFRPVYVEDIAEVNAMMDNLDAAYEQSTLPEKPEEEPFRCWLFNTRLAHGDV